MDDTEPAPRRTDPTTHILRWILGLLLAVLATAAAWAAYAYLSTPDALRYPASAHLHLRLQVITGSVAANFAEDKFQTPFDKDLCTAALTKAPVHFHDHVDQFAHLHWNHITGGILLKDYGWNFIGGTNSTLGYRFDHLPKIVPVKIHGNALPPRVAGARYYIYTGDQAGYQERDWNEFLKSDLRDFMAADKHTPTSFLDHIIPGASAHGVGESELLKINDVVGSVVIFAQTSPPTTAEVKDRFNRLVALPESSCGG